MKELVLLDENLRAAMQFFAGATGTGDVQHFDSSLAIHSGLDYGVFNIAMLTQAVKPGARGLEARSRIALHITGRVRRDGPFGCAISSWTARLGARLAISFIGRTCGRSRGLLP